MSQPGPVRHRFTPRGNWATYFGVAPDCEDPVDPVDPDDPELCVIWEARTSYDGEEFYNRQPDLVRTDDGSILSPTEGLLIDFTISTGNIDPLSIFASTALSNVSTTFRMAQLFLQP